MVTELNKDNFSSTIAGGPVIVDFWAEWCGPCKMMAPVFEELSADYDGKLAFAKLNTEQAPEIAGEQGISGIPCLIVYKDGKEVDRIVGFAPKDELNAKIQAVVDKL